MLNTLHIFHMALMKLIAIFIIMYSLAYQNISNHIPLFITIYLYLASAQVDAITLLNYLSILVLYSIFVKKLRSITISSITFIKK